MPCRLPLPVFSALSGTCRAFSPWIVLPRLPPTIFAAALVAALVWVSTAGALIALVPPGLPMPLHPAPSGAFASLHVPDVTMLLWPMVLLLPGVLRPRPGRVTLEEVR